MIKVLAMPGHTTEEGITGVDYARIINPMKTLNGKHDIQVDILTPKKDKKTTVVTWWERAKKYDIFYLNYNNNPKGFAAMGCMAKKEGKKIVCDLDDSLWNIKSDNTAYNAFKKGSEGLRVVTAILKESDYITCTNPYLKNVIRHNTDKQADKIKVFRNYIDLDLYKFKIGVKDRKNITIMHFGSTSHFQDLQDGGFLEGMDMLMKEYPNVIFKTIGAFISKYKHRWGTKYSHGYGSQDLYTWVKEKFPIFMKEADIIVAPLEEDVYTRCKSSIKYIEASSAKKPGVWQNIRQYSEVVDGENGLLARTSREWYEAMKSLVESYELRKSVGQKAYETTKKNWQMKNHIKEYADFFKEIVDK